MSSVSAAAKSQAAPGLDFEHCAEAVSAAERLLHLARSGVRKAVEANGGLDASQAAAHGLAWVATYVEALRQMLGWARRLEAEGRLTEMERLITAAAFGEYLAQLAGGIPMSQVETVRLSALGVPRAEIRRFEEQVGDLIDAGTHDGLKARLAEMIAAQPAVTTFGDTGLDETLSEMRTQMRRFAEAEVLPHAHEWHLKNEYIPCRGAGQAGRARRVRAHPARGVRRARPRQGGHVRRLRGAVTRLHRRRLARHALGDRRRADPGRRHRRAEAEVAAEDRLAASCLPTAVFTEPNTGSDLASLKTRAAREGDVYKVTGQKTWITHAVRADLMTLLVRTNPNEKGYEGLSMFLARKPRGSDDDPFPAKGMTGGEIEVLGYRGMKEFDISFDGFEVPAGKLLGRRRGPGLQAADDDLRGGAHPDRGARHRRGPVGPRHGPELRAGAQAVRQGRSIAFPRVADKIAMMAAETMVARQLTYFAAREKDPGPALRPRGRHGQAARGARIAWANADNALQIHGGNGFALEYPVSRLLCDARIL